MIFNIEPLAADGTPNDEGLSAMRAALRDLKVTIRRDAEHPRRGEMLAILGEAKAQIERINTTAA